ncbi:MAG: hypothetical protein WBG50_26455, partial [Desulfomonilaceae bacterium]
IERHQATCRCISSFHSWARLSSTIPHSTRAYFNAYGLEACPTDLNWCQQASRMTTILSRTTMRDGAEQAPICANEVKSGL